MPRVLGTVWAIDIGNESLKALHLRSSGEAVEVIGFSVIEHDKLLSSGSVSELERDEVIALTLRRFIRENSIGNEPIVVSVPSQNSFARFVTLPPVEQKKIPQVVKLEAGMQIPFDMSEVQWDWQLMSDSSSQESRVGIFAVKNDVVEKVLEYFSGENLKVTHIQMSPMALYNYVVYDRPELVKSDDEGAVVINIGAESTDLVVCTKSSVWQRCVTMGGNSFTRAVQETFRVGFEKAEKLKKTAPVSKYARQLFQAMRPVYTDLASEIQRSLGFYSSSNPNTKLTSVIAFGGGTKLRGLLKYLQQSLQIPVERPEAFKKLVISSEASAAKFHDNVGDFGVVYGLAVQALGFGKIEINLLPQSVARSMVWASKAKYFTVATAVLLLVSVLSVARTFMDSAKYSSQDSKRQRIKRVIQDAEAAHDKLRREQARERESKSTIEKAEEPYKHRDVIPLVHETILSILPNAQNNPEQSELYEAFANDDVRTVLKTPRKERKQMFLTGMKVYFVEDIETAKFGETEFKERGPSRREEDMEYDFMEEDEPFSPFGAPGRAGRGRGSAAMGTRYSPVSRARDKKFEIEEGEGGPGFLVVLSGYSPYGNIDELMDPVGVKDDQSQWGFITRLMNLDSVVDGNSPFKLYRKTVKEHFELEHGEVDLQSEMPAGIGIEEVRKERGAGTEYVLLDPMTKELISKVAQLDKSGKERTDKKGKAIYEVNDHWFVLKFKLRWEDMPKEEGDDV